MTARSGWCRDAYGRKKGHPIQLPGGTDIAFLPGDNKVSAGRGQGSGRTLGVGEMSDVGLQEGREQGGGS